MRQGAKGWCTGMTLRDGLGREEGGRVRMGNTCTPMADSCNVWQKPPQYCKVVSLQLNFLKKEKKKKEIVLGKQDNHRKERHLILFISLTKGNSKWIKNLM